MDNKGNPSDKTIDTIEISKKVSKKVKPSNKRKTNNEVNYWYAENV